MQIIFGSFDIEFLADRRVIHTSLLPQYFGESEKRNSPRSTNSDLKFHVNLSAEVPFRNKFFPA